MSNTPIRDWPRAMAKRLKMSGSIEFTRAAVGQTLHLPCCGDGGHIVDVHIAAHQHPDAVAKKLLGAGWTMGSKLKCPEHSRRTQAKPKKAQPKSRFLSDTAPRSAVLSHAADQILAGETAYKITSSDEKGALEGHQLFETNRWQRRALKSIHDIPEPSKNKVQDPIPAPLKEKAKMPAVSQEKPQPTEAAKKAKRMVYLLLEEQYDDLNKRYRPGWDDQKVSIETGAHINVVKDVREESFGPLGEPSEFSTLRAQLEAHKQDSDAKISEIRAGQAALERRFNAICLKNGWPNV